MIRIYVKKKKTREGVETKWLMLGRFEIRNENIVNLFLGFQSTNDSSLKEIETENKMEKLLFLIIEKLWVADIDWSQDNNQRHSW